MPAPLRKFWVFLIGVGSGAICFVMAIGLIPPDIDSFSEHDLQLARNIGFMLPALAGCVLGCIEGSLARMLRGVLVGSLIGLIYAALCGEQFVFDLIIFGYPCLCGGLLAVGMGSMDAELQRGIFSRLYRGAFAGLVLGSVYMVLLNVFFVIYFVLYLHHEPNLTDYHRMLWFCGPPALGIANGLFILLLRWATAGKNKTDPIVE